MPSRGDVWDVLVERREEELLLSAPLPFSPPSLPCSLSQFRAHLRGGLFFLSDCCGHSQSHQTISTHVLFFH